MTDGLHARDLHVVYGHGRNRLHAVRGVTVSVTTETSLGLAGESGSGKSTVARALVGLLEPAQGSVSWNGSSLSELAGRGPGSRARTVQMVMQDPMSSLHPRMTAGEAIREVLASNAIPGDHRAETIRLLRTVDLDSGAADKYPFQLSGGQRQRVALARALAVRPEVLICDEMTSALDVSVQAQVLNLLRSIREETGLALAVVSHNLDVLRYLCDEIAVMRAGEVIEQASSEQLFRSPQHEYTRMLLAAVPRFTVKPGVVKGSAA